MHSRRIGGTQARTQVMRIGHAIEDQQQGLLLFVFEHVQNLVGIGGKFPGLGQCDHALMTGTARSEEHTSELQSLMRNSYAVFCLKKKKQQRTIPKLTKSRKDII